MTKPVRDLRRSHWYWIDNAFMEHYAAIIGPYAVTVYNYLAKLADKEGTCFPSYKNIAIRTGISKSSAQKAIDSLRKYNIISSESRPSGEGDMTSNEYTLLPLEEWSPTQNFDPKTGMVFDGIPGAPKNIPIPPENLGVSAEAPPAFPGAIPRMPPRGKYKTPPKLQDPQQQEPVVAVEKTTLSEEETTALIRGLEGARVEPTAASYLVASLPDRARTVVAWLAAHPAERSKLRGGGAARSMVENPEKWPQVYAAPESPSPTAPAPKPLTPAQTEARAAAIKTVYQAQTEKYRVSIDKDPLGREAYITKYHADELAAELRKTK